MSICALFRSNNPDWYACVRVRLGHAPEAKKENSPLSAKSAPAPAQFELKFERHRRLGVFYFSACRVWFYQLFIPFGLFKLNGSPFSKTKKKKTIFFLLKFKGLISYKSVRCAEK